MKDKPRIIVITGGSGSGKTTATFGIKDKFPNSVSVVHFDDYNKPVAEVPLIEGFPNWDHPDAIKFDLLLNDLQDLVNNKEVVVMTKNERDNPDYFIHRKRLPIKVLPKPIILLEGYLALYNPEIRKIISQSFFLDLSHEERIKRRTKFIIDEYTDKVMIPMYDLFVEPTKEYADEILNVSKMNQDEVINHIIQQVKLFIV